MGWRFPRRLATFLLFLGLAAAIPSWHSNLVTHMEGKLAAVGVHAVEHSFADGTTALRIVPEPAGSPLNRYAAFVARELGVALVYSPRHLVSRGETVAR